MAQVAKHWALRAAVITRMRAIACNSCFCILGFIVTSVFRGHFFGVIDDKGVQRGFGGYEAQAELLLQGTDNGQAGGIGWVRGVAGCGAAWYGTEGWYDSGRSAETALVGREFKYEVVFS